MAEGRAATVRKLPHTDEQGIRSLGMTCFLLASTMAFGGMLVLHLALGGRPPPHADPLPFRLAAVATGLLLLSSAVLHRGVRSVLRARPRKLLPALVATLGLGLLFLAVELVIWRSLWRDGYAFGVGRAGSFYAVTCFHFVHVAVALGLLVWLLPGAAAGRYHGRAHVRVRLVARFWHFLGIHWLLIVWALFLP